MQQFAAKQRTKDKGQRTTNEMKFLRSFIFFPHVAITFSSAAYYAQVKTANTQYVYCRYRILFRWRQCIKVGALL